MIPLDAAPLDLDALALSVPRPDAAAGEAARQALDALAKPLGALGRLEDLAVWLAACQATASPRPIRSPQVVIFAGDHGIAAAGVSAYPSEVTGLMVRTFVSGRAAINVLAARAEAVVRVVDLGVAADLSDLPADVTAYKVNSGSGQIDREDALTRADAERAFRIGMRIADECVDAGADLLIAGDMGIGNTTPATALTLVLAGGDVSLLVGRGTGIDDHTWMRKTAAVRDAARRGRPHKGDPLALLSAIGSADLAAMSGFLVQAAIRRTPVILDGVITGAAALVAQRISFRTVRWFVAGHRSVEPAHTAALSRLDLEPLLDLGLRLGEGTGAVAALPLVQSASDLLTDMATLAEVIGDTAP